MPTQLPLESTDLFGDLLLPHTFDILESDAKKPLDTHTFSFPVYSVDHDMQKILVPQLFSFHFLHRVLWLVMET